MWQAAREAVGRILTYARGTVTPGRCTSSTGARNPPLQPALVTGDKSLLSPLERGPRRMPALVAFPPEGDTPPGYFTGRAGWSAAGIARPSFVASGCKGTPEPA